MEISLIMNQNSYVGREYLEALKKEDIKVDVLSIGLHPERDLIEEERCGKLWSPKDQVSLAKYHYFYNFPHLKSKQLNRFLIMKKYDLGIQGGTDIIKENIIDKYKLGILNFHPGLLPQYRGCSAPEWQIYENKNVYSTCHIIDKGIDTGKIVAKKQLNTNYKSYYHFRASIYKEISIFLVNTIKNIIENKGFVNKPYNQEEKIAVYRKYIGKKKIDYIKKNYFNE
tara:strand:- start:3605 stop:4282 length:678 start_codon:yes stop_codon:yes gene_type:complete